MRISKSWSSMTTDPCNPMTRKETDSSKRYLQSSTQSSTLADIVRYGGFLERGYLKIINVRSITNHPAIQPKKINLQHQEIFFISSKMSQTEIPSSHPPRSSHPNSSHLVVAGPSWPPPGTDSAAPATPSCSADSCRCRAAPGRKTRAPPCWWSWSPTSWWMEQ